jgi:RND superfamily putative drug exporter
VVTGISRTGRLVTSAALILFLAFTALAGVPVADVQIFATALAAGIIIDATLVRGILTPALITLLARANWWWPGATRGPATASVDPPPEARGIYQA